MTVETSSGTAGEPRAVEPGAVPRVVFGLMSAQQSDQTVTQLVDALAPHPVLIHHDFSKLADFHVRRPHVALVPEPKLTGWGTWGFAEAILHTIRHALRAYDFDYFQLLSPTCLPIRALAEFQAHVAQDPADIHADLIPIGQDDDWLMTFGYRLFVPQQSWRFRVLRRLRGRYFGPDAELHQFRSLSILRPQPDPAGRARSRRRIALSLTRLAAFGGLGEHPFGRGLQPMVGSCWFGARRAACEHLVRAASDMGLRRFFSRLHHVDESLFATLLGNSGFRLGPSNHIISPFNEHGNPRWMDESDLPSVLASGRYFARKFPESTAASVRQRVLAWGQTNSV